MVRESLHSPHQIRFVGKKRGLSLKQQAGVCQLVMDYYSLVQLLLVYYILVLVLFLSYIFTPPLPWFSPFHFYGKQNGEVFIRSIVDRGLAGSSFCLDMGWELGLLRNVIYSRKVYRTL